MELESKKRIESLIAAANAKTGIEAADLTEAVQELCNGYGSGSGGDSGLATAIIERTVKEVNDDRVWGIGDYAFIYCLNLITADFPNAAYVYERAFSNCVNLTNINLPYVEEIYTDAFYMCSKLSSVDLPTIISISAGAFYECTELTALILRRKNFPVDDCCVLAHANAFTSTPIASGAGYIYVPRDLVDTYKIATNWATFANQFRALEDYTVDGTITGALDPNKI